MLADGRTKDTVVILLSLNDARRTIRAFFEHQSYSSCWEFRRLMGDVDKREVWDRRARLSAIKVYQKPTELVDFFFGTERTHEVTRDGGGDRTRTCIAFRPAVFKTAQWA